MNVLPLFAQISAALGPPAADGRGKESGTALNVTGMPRLALTEEGVSGIAAGRLHRRTSIRWPERQVDPDGSQYVVGRDAGIRAESGHASGNGKAHATQPRRRGTFNQHGTGTDEPRQDDCGAGMPAAYSRLRPLSQRKSEGPGASRLMPLESVLSVTAPRDDVVWKWTDGMGDVIAALPERRRFIVPIVGATKIAVSEHVEFSCRHACE